MLIEVFKSKIHRVTVTASDLNYIGSITVDEDLIDAAGLVVGERVYIVNVNNGERFDTYVIKGKRKSGEICLNGPAARKVQKGDVIIIISYAQMSVEEAQNFQPKIIFWFNSMSFLFIPFTNCKRVTKKILEDECNFNDFKLIF